LFFIVFFAQHQFKLDDTSIRFLQIAIWAFVYFFAVYWFSGKSLNYFMSRNIPFVVCMFIVLSIVAYMEAGVGWYLHRQELKFSDFIWHGFSKQVVFIATIVICSMFFEKKFKEILGYDPENVPFWFPVNRDVDQILALLPRVYRGKLLKLKASRQYVEVTTDKGTFELRASLKSLVDILPKNRGVHLHRSIWLNINQMKELTYNDNGNPVVIDIHDNVIPVGRTRIDLVKKALQPLR